MDIQKIRRDINGRLLSAHWNKRAVRPLNALLAVVGICECTGTLVEKLPTLQAEAQAGLASIITEAIARELGVDGKFKRGVE
jgi:hypothetical protein